MNAAQLVMNNQDLGRMTYFVLHQVLVNSLKENEFHFCCLVNILASGSSIMFVLLMISFIVFVSESLLTFHYCMILSQHLELYASLMHVPVPATLFAVSRAGLVWWSFLK